MNDDFYTALQKRIANTSIGPSTARGMGPKGTIAAARSFLMKIDLTKFAVTSQAEFVSMLNKATSDLRQQLPDGARYWGAARKFLNIFLRGAVYNRYLCRKFQLSGIEPWLEIPIDSHVVKGLQREPNSQGVPNLKSIIGLTHWQNRHYQEFADKVAKNRKMNRVHLDLYYWRNED
jgi:hypothetical protein